MASNKTVQEETAYVQVLSLAERVKTFWSKGKSLHKKGKKIVAIVGSTTAGKSTLINCLLGAELMSVKDPLTWGTSIVKISETIGPKIGGGGESETLVPAGYQNVSDADYTIWDFPGFFDNRSSEQEVVNALFHQKVLSKSSVRFVLVESINRINDSNPLPFFKILNDVQNICPQVENSLCLVFTKSLGGNVRGMLQKMITYDFPNTDQSNLRIIEVGKKMIKKVLENRAFVDFHAPVLAEDENMKRFTFPKLKQLEECIKNLKEAKLADVPLMISDSAKCELTTLHDIFYQMLQKEIAEIGSSFDQQVQETIKSVTNADGQGESTSSRSQLDIFKKEKARILRIKESANLTEMFKQFKREGVIIDSKFQSRIENFSFIENLRKSYEVGGGVQSANGEAEFYNSLLLTLMKGLQSYDEQIMISHSATEAEQEEAQASIAAREAEKVIVEAGLQQILDENERFLVKAARLITGIFDAAFKKDDSLINSVFDAGEKINYYIKLIKK